MTARAIGAVTGRGQAEMGEDLGDHRRIDGGDASRYRRYSRTLRDVDIEYALQQLGKAR